MARALSGDCAQVPLSDRYGSLRPLRRRRPYMCHVAPCSSDWQSMIISELLRDEKWITEYTESQVEMFGNERKRRADKQRSPAARRKRARIERRAATSASAKRNQSGYQPVRSLEAGTEKEARQEKPRQLRARRTSEQLREQWDRGERKGLHECQRCHRIMTSKPENSHYDTNACKKKSLP